MERDRTMEKIEPDQLMPKDLARMANTTVGRMMTARAVIVAHTEGKRGVGGVIECPVCKTGKLRFSVARCNGHVHAACTTDKCVRWME